MGHDGKGKERRINSRFRKALRSVRKALRFAFAAAFLATAALAGTATYLYSRADDSLEFDLSSRSVTEVTQLYKIQVGRVVTPHSTEEIATALGNSSGPVSIGGARCSMGGQIAEPGSIHLDLRQFRDVLSFSREERTITVEAGITWRDIQEHIDPHELAVKIMQTYSNFTVGGSLSVNAHGRYMGRGPIVQSVRSLKLVLPDGSVVQASPAENAELFYGAIGGYGAIGVIAEVTLDLVPNSKVERTTETLSTENYPKFFQEHVKNHPQIVFHNADLHPPDFETARVVSWVATTKELTDDARLIARHDTYSWTPRLINDLAKAPFGFALRKHVLEPLFYSRSAVTWRNHEASYDIAELEPPSRTEETFVLREYFVPEAKFAEFLPKMRAIFTEEDVSVVNISVRHASADPKTLLAWARGDTFAFVVYYRQGTSAEAMSAVGEWSRKMVDAVLSVGGAYYLPYQNHATSEQFRAAYPRADEFFALKKKVDPNLRLQNSLIYAYGPSPRAERDARLRALGYATKPEGQTLLTIPEWYLVWNPVEYAEHLEKGRAPDEFPWAASVQEYASLYKKVLRASAQVYPKNDEYLTMLHVIGVSTAVEYLVKAAYEASVGRVFRALSDGIPTQEDKVIARAARAYADLIFDEPWYKFRFLPWAGRIWSETPILGPNFLRRTERKLAFSAEYLVKALYAELLGMAAESAYGPAEEHIDTLVRARTEASPLPEGLRAQATLETGESLVQLERWKEFSEDVPRLAQAGFDFVEIAGNDDIAVSLVEPPGVRFQTERAPRLLTSKVVSSPSRRRSVWLVPVRELSAFLEDARTQGARLEHVYDY